MTKKSSEVPQKNQTSSEVNPMITTCAVRHRSPLDIHSPDQIASHLHGWHITFNITPQEISMHHFSSFWVKLIPHVGKESSPQ